jgi:1-pyrroline-5-carboxylate dehydrogenase
MLPQPINEPVLTYAPGTAERFSLKNEIARLGSSPVEIPLVIGGRELRTGDTGRVRSPHDHSLDLGIFHNARPGDVQEAITGALVAQRAWMRTPLAERLAIFLRAADLLAGPRRATLNAATVLGQSKTAHQAEIDAACELIDFWRWNAHFAARVAEEQPVSGPGMHNELEARALEGFVLAVTPFNFTAIAGNLPTAPAMMGNTVVWKPAPNAMLAAWHVYSILREAGLPDGVIQFVPGAPEIVGDPSLVHPDLAGVHFTGSTRVFRHMWKTIGANIENYRTFPRIVGETGGKDFVLLHPSADVDAAAAAVVRGGYEFQGQKCSAASRVYVPESLWPRLEERLRALIAEITVGDPSDFRNFMGAVIDEAAFHRIEGYIQQAHIMPTLHVLAGGTLDKERGWFIQPTLVRAEDPKHRLMTEEIFGPVVTVYVYPDAEWREAIALVDETSPYALTGAIWSQDRAAIADARSRLLHAAGNLYINDKPTGAVVGQQPFGGARASGTNDKAGSLWNLVRWISPRTVKETYVPPKAIGYPFMAEP